MIGRRAPTTRATRWTTGTARVGCVAGVLAIVGACGAPGGGNATAPTADPRRSAESTSTARVPTSDGGPASIGSPTGSSPDASTAGSVAPPTTTGPPTTVGPSTTTATTAAPTPPTTAFGDAVVGMMEMSYRDPGRDRRLPTRVYWRRSVAGPAPRLVVVAHGYLLPGWGYERLARQVAAAGYVVAVPDFPHTSAVGGDGNRSDIVNQPADLSFVADQVLARRFVDGTTTPWPAVDPAQTIGVIGHSDGGLTATAFAYGANYRDQRVGACVSLTGGIGLFPGAFYASPSPPPVLAAHGTGDTTNPYSASTNLATGHPDGGTTGNWLLTVDQGSHLGPFMFETARADVGRVVVAFLDAALRTDAPARAALVDPSPLDLGPDLTLAER